MASIKSALKKVYKSLSGGTDTSAKSISGIIDDISNVASGGSGGGGVLYVNVVYNDGAATLDKTWKEIHDALVVEKKAIFSIEDVDGYYTVYSLMEIYINSGSYCVGIGVNTYITDNENGYPVLS